MQKKSIRKSLREKLIGEESWKSGEGAGTDLVEGAGGAEAAAQDSMNEGGRKASVSASPKHEHEHEHGNEEDDS